MTPNPGDKSTGAAAAPASASALGAPPAQPSPPPSSPAVAWCEIGRGERGDARWATWIGFADGRGGRGDAFYRPLVVAGDAIASAVAVEAETALRSRGAPPRASRLVRPAAG